MGVQTYKERLGELSGIEMEKIIQGWNDLGFHKTYGVAVKAREAGSLISATDKHFLKLVNNGEIVGFYTDDDHGAKRYFITDILSHLAERKAKALIEAEL
jgi:hypothetical protein